MIFNHFLQSKEIELDSLEAFFITYDEPRKDMNWANVRKQHSSITRIDNIKGFDKAHKLCASLCSARRLVTIDGDNELLPSFHSTNIKDALYDSEYILSWSSVNSVNGLTYGNGGVKCWPTRVLHQMNSHESSQHTKGAVDFCFDLQYYQFSEVLSISTINHTPYQAFRAGFREGVKMGLVQGEKYTPDNPQNAKLLDSIASANLERLRIWATVGQDVKNGVWAIYGARLGFYYLYTENKPLELVRDYDWFNSFWSSSIFNKFTLEQSSPYLNFHYDQKNLELEIMRLGEHLNNSYGLDICDYNSQQSDFFKRSYRNIPREGPMIL